MTTHSSILAWRIPWADEPARLQSMGSQGFGHDRVTEHIYRKILISFLLNVYLNSFVIWTS